MAKGTRYTPEFKAKAVRLLAESRSSYSSETNAISAVAKDLGIAPESLRRWRNQSDATVAEETRQSAEDAMAELKKLQYARTGVADPKFYDDAFCFADGNPAPHGTPEEILAAGRAMYHALSPETAEFIDEMFDGGLFDVLSKEGKAPGGYCTYLADYKAPFIFSNFNGTSDDVDVLTHEAGHAFAAWVAARKDLPMILEEPGMESCEIHSMSMEFLTAEHHEKFFGTDTPRYELAHAEDAMYFLPYGTMVDEFQHIMYAEPDLTPGERNAVWAKLESELHDMQRLGDRIPPGVLARAGSASCTSTRCRSTISTTAWPKRWRCSSSPRFCTTKRTPGGGTWLWWARPAARRIRVSWRRPGWTARLLPERWRSWAKKWARGSRRRTPR